MQKFPVANPAFLETSQPNAPPPLFPKEPEDGGGGAGLQQVALRGVHAGAAPGAERVPPARGPSADGHARGQRIRSDAHHEAVRFHDRVRPPEVQGC